MDILQSIILGAVEGLTEFLPVSSTGHLILTSELMGIKQDSFHKTFEIIIQLGSILSVIFVFKDKIIPNNRESITLWKKLIVAFIPTGILGFLFYKHIKALFAPETVAFMLIFGGIIFIALEYFYKEERVKINNTNEISYKQAFFIGLFQSISMIPGTSRSGATIVGGLLLGFNRRVATEFSFLLAVPTMFMATAYDVYKNYEQFNFDNTLILIVGFLSAFTFAFFAIKTFLTFVAKFNFIPFGVYRILIGVIFLYYLY